MLTLHLNRWHAQLFRAPPGTAASASRRTACAQAQRRSQHLHSAAGRAEPHTLYDLLGVRPECTVAELRAAYRRHAARLHPDINPGASPAEFQAITQAFDLLKDGELRRRYDQHGLKAFGANEYTVLRARVSRGTGERGGAGRPGQLGAVRGEDLHSVLGLRLGESVTGVKRVVELEALGACDLCHGLGREVAVTFMAGVGGRDGGHEDSGSDGGAGNNGEGQEECAGDGSAPPSSSWQPSSRGAMLVDPDCPVCHGSGEVLRTTWQPTGFKVVALGTCPACGGTGTQAQALCMRCGGEGRTLVTRRVTVRVPGGVTSSSVMRVAGCGHAGRCGGPPGDLLLRFKVLEEPDMERRGRDLYSRVTCGVLQALLGDSVAVRSVRGERLLIVPPGSQHGDLVQLTHAGVPEVQQGGSVQYGHHYFALQIQVPDGSLMGDAERALLLRLRRAIAAQGSAGDPG